MNIPQPFTIPPTPVDTHPSSTPSLGGTPTPPIIQDGKTVHIQGGEDLEMNWFEEVYKFCILEIC